MVTHGNAHVLHLGEHFKAVFPALAAGAGRFHAAKRLTQIAYVLGIDENHPRFNIAGQTQHLAHILRPDIRRQAVLHVVGHTQAVFF
ncbi:hypothetical protein D3C71_1986220 [compost metagenome]